MCVKLTSTAFSEVHEAIAVSAKLEFAPAEVFQTQGQFVALHRHSKEYTSLFQHSTRVQSNGHSVLILPLNVLIRISIRP